MTAWKFKRIFKDHKHSDKYKKWFFEQIKDQVVSIRKVEYETVDSDTFAINITCGQSFELKITISERDLRVWEDDDISHSVIKQLLGVIIDAGRDEFV